MKHLAVLTLALALATAACGGGDDGSGTTPDTVDPNALVLEVRNEGGFAPIEFIYNPAPQYVLYADGRLLVPGPIPEIFPGPLVTNYHMVQLDEGDMSTVREAIDTTGLPDIVDEHYVADEGVADAPDTVFVYVDDAPHRASIYALGISPDTNPEIEPYADLYGLLGTFAVSETAVEWDADRYQVIITSSFGVENDELATVEPWPLSTPAADIPVTGFGELQCVVLDGSDAATAGEIFATANQMTFFEDAGEVYRFNVRPLAPHEQGCPT